MIIHHLKIENFRGIRALDWHLQGRVLCLVGPNDSSKTTILDAIEFALLPRSSIQFTDADFHNGDIANAIAIEVTVGELPRELIVDDKCGLYQRGYQSGIAIKDDPADDCEGVITLRLAVDKELEATWTLIKPNQDPKRVGWQDRERLGVARLGNDVERHLTWGRGSALAKLTGKSNSTSQTFAAVVRAAKQIVAESDKLKEFADAASNAGESAKDLGAELEDLKPGLDVLGLFMGSSVLGLHEGNIPMRLWGLGTKRLLALAIQQSGVGQQSVLLIDEIEHGLEPHRIRHLLKQLSLGTDGKERAQGQVIFSTHSPTLVIELPIEDMRFVRSKAGKTTIMQVQTNHIKAVQGIARTRGHALFGRKLLVCEGATEVGLCRGLLKYWAGENGGRDPVNVGFIALDGKGRTDAPGVALELKRIGYDAALIADTDEPIDPKAEVLIAEQVPVFLWEGTMSTEERLAVDLPMQAIQQIIDAAFDEYGSEPVLSHVSEFSNENLSKAGKTVSDWLRPTLSEAKLRAAIGKAAKEGKLSKKEKGWFKNVTMGKRLGEIVAEALPQIPKTPTAMLLKQVMDWIYA